MVNIDSNKIVNVSGWQNNCGANVFLCAIFDNFDLIDFSLPQYRSLLDVFSETFGVAGTPKNFCHAYHAVDGYVQKQVVFGPIIRQHMAQLAKQDENYRTTLSVQLSAMLRDIFSQCQLETSEQPLYIANADEINKLRNLFYDKQKNSIKIDNDYLEWFLDTYVNKRLNEFTDKYIDTLGDTNKALMLSTEELQNYANKMGIKANVFRRTTTKEKKDIYNLEDFNDNDDSQTSRNTSNLFTLNIINVGHAHWMYEAPYLSEQEIEKRNSDCNIAPEDRKPDSLALYMQSKGQEYISTIKDTIRKSLYEHKSQLPLFEKANEFLYNQFEDETKEIDQVAFEERFDALAQAIQEEKTVEQVEDDLLTTPIARPSKKRKTS